MNKMIKLQTKLLITEYKQVYLELQRFLIDIKDLESVKKLSEIYKESLNEKTN